MIPWYQDEKDKKIHSDYVRLLASMDSRSREKASKHAIAAAYSLLKAQRELKISTSGDKRSQAGSQPSVRLSEATARRSS